MITETNFEVPIFHFKVEVVVFDKLDEVKVKYSEFLLEGADACTVEYVNASKAKVIIPSNNYVCVVHELEHIKNLIWKAKGYKPQEGNDEVDAYLIEYLFERIDKIIKKHLSI